MSTMKNFTSVISSSRKIKISFWLAEAKFSDFVTQTEDFSFFSLSKIICKHAYMEHKI